MDLTLPLMNGKCILRPRQCMLKYNDVLFNGYTKSVNDFIPPHELKGEPPAYAGDAEVLFSHKGEMFLIIF